MAGATAALPDYCLVGDSTILNWYRGLLDDGVINADTHQATAVQLLQDFADTLRDKTAEAGDGWRAKLRRLWRAGGDAPTAVAATGAGAAGESGLYFHGGVGRGKSFLMDGFYLQLPVERKLRVHFHQFMRRLHADMKAAEAEQDPLLHVATALGRRFDLICFDEFHVSDITDAMLLGRLLEHLLAANTRFIMTSNYPPSGLYPNGLARERFLPTIALLEARLRVVALDGDDDYRQRHLSHHPAYFSPWDEAARRRMRDSFNGMACGIVLQQNIKLSGRVVPVIARTTGGIWFGFDALCEAARSKDDYLQLAERFATVFLSDVPPLFAPERREAARRFTWLVDVLYDRRINLIIGAHTPLADLYGDGEGGESGRTLSRLVEMQSDEYKAAARPSSLD